MARNLSNAAASLLPYLKLTILFVKMLFQKIQQVEVKPVK